MVNTSLSLKIEENPGRSLPYCFRLVIYRCPDCGSFAAATSNGPERIPAERAQPLIEGAEVLDLASESQEKRPVRGDVKTEVVENTHPFCNSPFKAPEPRVEHFPDRSTPDESAVPKEDRDRPNDPETIEQVLSRDGFFCKIPGCTDLAEESHHIRWREHGRRTVATHEAGLWRGHHDSCLNSWGDWGSA